MSGFDTQAGNDFIALVPEFLQSIAAELKRANDMKEVELKLMQKKLEKETNI